MAVLHFWMRVMLTGSLVALVTPMLADGQIDWDAYRALIDWHIAQGTDALVVVGTTGESPTVDVDEHLALIRVAVAQVAGRLPVIAGTGANSTREAIALTEAAASLGAVAGLSVTPYYNKPTQAGLFQHYKAIAQASALPLILYNVPGRAAVDLHNDTVLALAQLPNIIGLKDATGNIERGTDLIQRVRSDANLNEFALYSGDDATALPFMLLGGDGVISVTANVAPRAMQQLCQLARAGELLAARAVNQQLFALHRHLFVEANPIPVKWALQRMGKIQAGIRAPLTELSSVHHALIEQALSQAQLLV